MSECVLKTTACKGLRVSTSLDYVAMTRACVTCGMRGEMLVKLLGDRKPISAIAFRSGVQLGA